MKKLLLSAIALGSCFLLVGCGGTSEEATITNLSNQIDKLNNVISNTKIIENKDIDVSNFSNGNDTGAIKNIYQKTASSLHEQENLKEKIKNKTAIIKTTLSSQNLQLGNNTKALQELSNSLSKYTSRLYSTNSEFKKVSQAVSNLKSNSNTTNTDLGAKLTRLSSCCDSRVCYYNNILNTLTQIQSILNGGAYVDQNGNLNNNYFNAYNLNNLYDSNGNVINGYCNNGSCYDTNGNVINDYCFDSNGNCINGNCAPNRAYYQNENYLSNNNYLTNYETIPNNPQNPNENLNPNNKRYFHNANNGYRNGTFNPNRNTDTYGPGITNIDTYRNYNGTYNNRFNGFNSNNGLNSITTDLNDKREEISNKTNELINQDENIIEDLTQTPKTLELKPEDYIDTNTIKTTETISEIKEENIEVKHKTKDIKDEDLIEKKAEVISEELLSTLELEKKDKEPIENLRLKLKADKRKDIDEKSNSALISKDYQKTNQKIKDLIQSNAPASNDF